VLLPHKLMDFRPWDRSHQMAATPRFETFAAPARLMISTPQLMMRRYVSWHLRVQGIGINVFVYLLQDCSSRQSIVVQ
jgi:hypothetical protein